MKAVNMSRDPSQEEADGENQTLIEHLTALRKCLMWSLIFIAIGFAACWGVSERVFDIIRQPIEPFLASTGGGLVFTAPMDKFLAHIKVSFLAGVIVSTPGWVYQIWKFIAPALYANEKRFGIVFIAFGTSLFLAGVSFVYFVVYPMAFEFLMNFGGSTDSAMITITDYLSFFIKTTIVFGLAFEMPLIFTILGMLGVVDHIFLSSKRRYAIVILAALSAVVTPPDVISMLLMMIPMLLLYESSIILVRVFGRKREA
jgi:sec-independent protein translocase protein TatC